MTDLVVIIANGKGHQVLGPDDSHGVVSEALSRWLTSALNTAIKSGVCVSFTVAVHHRGPDCDHELPGCGHA